MFNTTNGKIHTQTFLGGMNKDLDASVLPSDSYRNSTNIRITKINDKKGTIQFIPGVEQSYDFGESEFLSYVGGTVIRNYALFIFYHTTERVNYFYRYDNNETEEENRVKLIGKGPLGITANYKLSFVSRWEDDDNVKVYWADGVHQIRYLNILQNDKVFGPTDLDQVPDISVNKPEFVGYGIGQLNSGKIQYAYQFFNKNSVEAQISPLSDMIYLTKYSDGSKDTDIQGTSEDENSEASVILNINLNENTFEYVKIYSIYYKNNKDLPVVNVIYQGKLNKSQGNFTYEDFGTSRIEEITIEEFNYISGFKLTPKILATKDNYLFAANVKDSTWDIDFDARAYRFSRIKSTLLKAYFDPDNSDIDTNEIYYYVSTLRDSGNNRNYIVVKGSDFKSGNVDCVIRKSSTETEEIDKTHDCINPYNSYIGIRNVVLGNSDNLNINEYVETLNNEIDVNLATTDRNAFNNKVEGLLNVCVYGYIDTNDTQDVYRFGAIGNNVSFRTITSELAGYSNGEIPVLNSTSTASEKEIHYFDGFNEKTLYDSSTWDYSDAKRGSSDINNIIPKSYINTKIDGKLKSYQRDEIYRLGCVLYNSSGEKSTVKWICDMKMPKDADSFSEIFTYSGNINSNGTVKCKPLGLLFNFRNLPSEVTKVEIVRCERTANDRSILAQGVVGKVFKYDTNKTNLVSIRPTNFPSMCDSYSTIAMHGNVFDIAEPDNEDGLTTWFNTKFGYVNKTENELDDYFIFASPEISVNGEAFYDQIKNKSLYLQTLYTVTSTLGKTVDYVVRANTNAMHDVIYGVALAKNLGTTANPQDETIIDEDKTLPNDPGINISYRKDTGCYGIYYTKDSTKLLYVTGTYDNIDSPKTVSSRVRYYRDTLAFTYYYKNYIPHVSWHNVNKIGYAHNIIGNKSEIIDFKYAKVIDSLSYSGQSEDTLALDNMIQIGDNKYLNQYDTLFTNASLNNTNFVYNSKWGPHGACFIVNTNAGIINRGDSVADKFYVNGINSIGEGDLIPKVISISSTVMVNLRTNVTPYGGNSYNVRENSTYVSTGYIMDVDNGKIEDIPVFGGDTYINIFEWLSGYVNPIERSVRQRTMTVCYFPVETSINTGLIQEPEFRREQNRYINFYASDAYFNYTQAYQEYRYNNAYSVNSTISQNVSSHEFDETNKTFDCRIYGSDPKTNDETSDSWLHFRPADYIEVDTKYGPINGLNVFNNRLFFLQEKAFGTISVNERSLIQDNNPGQLVLGTGDKLQRYDYISERYGIRNEDTYTIVNSTNSFYWLDYLSKAILRFSENLSILSLEKNISTYLNTISLDNSVSISNAVSDNMNNEIYFTIDENTNDTLVYNEELGKFTSFYSFSPKSYFNFNTQLYSFKNNKLYLHNKVTNDNKIYGELPIYSLDFIANTDIQNIKVFDTITYPACDLIKPDSGIECIKCDTLSQTTGIVEPKIDNRETEYFVTIPRDNSKIKFGNRLRGKYMKCNITFKNINDFSLPYLNVLYRYSNI